MFERLQEITLFAPDINAYFAWLQEVVGARLALSLPGIIQCHIAGTLITLHPSDEKGSAGPGGQVAYWVIPDIEAAVSQFEHRGGRRYRGPIVGIDGPTVAQVQDPWGNVWGLWQQNPSPQTSHPGGL